MDFCDGLRTTQQRDPRVQYAARITVTQRARHTRARHKARCYRSACYDTRVEFRHGGIEHALASRPGATFALEIE